MDRGIMEVMVTQVVVEVGDSPMLMLVEMEELMVVTGWMDTTLEELGLERTYPSTPWVYIFLKNPYLSKACFMRCF